MSLAIYLNTADGGRAGQGRVGKRQWVYNAPLPPRAGSVVRRAPTTDSADARSALPLTDTTAAGSADDVRRKPIGNAADPRLAPFLEARHETDAHRRLSELFTPRPSDPEHDLCRRVRAAVRFRRLDARWSGNEWVGLEADAAADFEASAYTQLSSWLWRSWRKVHEPIHPSEEASDDRDKPIRSLEVAIAVVTRRAFLEYLRLRRPVRHKTDNQIRYLFDRQTHLQRWTDDGLGGNGDEYVGYAAWVTTATAAKAPVARASAATVDQMLKDPEAILLKGARARGLKRSPDPARDELKDLVDWLLLGAGGALRFDMVSQSIRTLLNISDTTAQSTSRNNTNGDGDGGDIDLAAPLDLARLVEDRQTVSVIWEMLESLIPFQRLVILLSGRLLLMSLLAGIARDRAERVLSAAATALGLLAPNQRIELTALDDSRPLDRAVRRSLVGGQNDADTEGDDSEDAGALSYREMAMALGLFESNTSGSDPKAETRAIYRVRDARADAMRNLQKGGLGRGFEVPAQDKNGKAASKKGQETPS